MLHMARLLLLPLGAAALHPWAPAAGITVTESGASGRQWAQQPVQAWSTGTAGAYPALTLDRSATRQEVLGFGSCFTDTSAYNALVYAQPAILAQFTEAVWGATGLRSSVMRAHINSPDYAVHTYNFDNVTSDFSLAHFDASLAYDQQRVIPLMRLAAAQAAQWTQHEIKIFASPWSPPGWMKQNNDMINSDAVCLKEDTPSGDSYRSTWARYILKWLQAYSAQNITMWGLTPQNEPGARQALFESCAYDVPHYVDFVGKYLGPTVLPAFPHLQIMAYDHNKLDSLAFAEGIAEDGAAASAVAGTAVHWYDYTQGLGLAQLDAIHALAPAKFILATEACFLESLVFDWENTGFLYAADIIADLNHWVVGWTAWNSLLLSGSMFPESLGGPNHDNTTHFGDGILLEFNSTGTQRLVFQSSYWIQGHFSRFMRPGSFIVPTTGAPVASTYADYEGIRARATSCRTTSCAPAAGFPLMSVGFTDPIMASAGVVVANINAGSVNFTLVDAQGARHSDCTIPGLSIQTYTFPTD